MKVLPNQNDKPEIVFLFGAGASYPDGVPLQTQIIPDILNDEDPQLRNSVISKNLEIFLTQNFPHSNQYPSLEEVFGFINFFLINDISLSADWSHQKLLQLKVGLTKVIHYIISKKTSKSENFKLFWEEIREKNKNIGIVTTNYDTLIDEAFDTIYPDCLLDYCLDFTNYRYEDGYVLDAFNWWVNPQKPTNFYNYIVPTRIKLIKIHGSLNWKYCDCCGQVTLTPWQHQINLKKDSFQSFLDSERQTSICPFDENKLSSLIQVPTHLKVNHNHIFNKLYDEALYLVRNAKILVFIGYSFPEADVHIRALIRRGFSENGKIIVINKSKASDLKYRYESLAKNVEYHQMTFERFVRSKLLKNILSNQYRVFEKIQ